MSVIRRREFVSLLGGVAAAWPLAARAQQPAMPVVGLLSSGSIEAYAGLTKSFLEGLKQIGYVEGQNVTIEARWGEGQRARVQQLATELVQRRLTVIVTTGNGSALAARSASTTIPLVFLSQGDPVQFGLVESLSRPGGNATGVALLASDLVAKRLGLVRQLAPAMSLIAFLVNPTAPETEPQLKEVEEAAHSIGQQIRILNASNLDDIHAAFETLSQWRAGAMIVSTDAYLFSQRDRIQALAARLGIPAIYDRREFALAGGLMSYGPHYADAFRQIGLYAGKILRGAKPADLPVEQVARFELVINLKAAKALGLEMPPTLVALADEVIE
jgi:putative ABC transport system substrate-binding protein